MRRALLAVLLLPAPALALSARQFMPRSAYVSDTQVIAGDQILEVDSLQGTGQPTLPDGRIISQSVPAFWEFDSKRWPGGVLPIVFSPVYSQGEQEYVLQLCREWSEKAGVRCVRRTRESDYIAFIKDKNLCNSTIGKQKRNNRLSLGDGCFERGVILHELGHAFGLLHEHQRRDRDQFITVNFLNIDPEWAGAYNILSNSRITRMFSTAYDLESIMHYGPSFFSAGGRPTFTLKPRHKAFEGRVGLQNAISRLDADGMRRFYGEGSPQPAPQPLPPPPLPDDGEVVEKPGRDVPPADHARDNG